VWCFGFLVTYVYWGITGILIGVVLAGIGVVPIGMLASVINGEWG
jgi:tetrahydromethanopterin S-methyltransferase subunit F